MPRRRSCGSVPGCRLSKRYPSINSLAVHCCTSHACRDAHCTIFSPVCRHCTSPRARVALTIESGAGIKSSQRPLLSRRPTSRDFVPWRFLDAGQVSLRRLLVAGVQKPSHYETFAIGSNSNIADDSFNNEACAMRRGSFR